ncbi:MAG: DNA repair protein RecN [Actinobacteria bacterium]|nr:DNA repair protein RecN [Actinomycetota bacterium]
MLRELHVRNLALIEEAKLDFGSGLNVLTGETGAGKTVLVEALGLLLGGRGDSGLLRTGSARLELEASFDIEGNEGLIGLAEEEGLDLEGGTLVLRRVISGDGKSRCYANGKMCTVGTLSRTGEYLVDIHGQNEHQRLLRQSSHLGYLDAYGSVQHEKLLQSYRELYGKWREVRDSLEKASMDEAERLHEIDLLRFQIGEIEAVKPVEGEMEELIKERKRMQNREELFTAAREAHALVAGEDGGEGALGMLGMAGASLDRAGSLDEDVASWSSRLRDMQEQLADLGYELRSYAESLDFEPGRLQDVEMRLRALSELARKYGRETSLIIRHLESARRRLDELEVLDTLREDLRKQVDGAEASLRRSAEALTGSRRDLSRKLSAEVNGELDELNMAGMHLRVEMERLDEFTPGGMDRVEFEVSPARGLPYGPIARIASGGELSRIMLALKLSLARADDVPTLVFDEVDAGIGGATADVLADKLSRISRYHQVFSITHLPQIAALSDLHMSVSKREAPQGVVTEVELLEGKEQLEELVRMLGGDVNTARKHAQSMIKMKAAVKR